jgi:hypothetical protein
VAVGPAGHRHPVGLCVAPCGLFFHSKPKGPRLANPACPRALDWRQSAAMASGHVPGLPEASNSSKDLLAQGTMRRSHAHHATKELANCLWSRRRFLILLRRARNLEGREVPARLDQAVPFMQHMTWTRIALHAGVLPGPPPRMAASDYLCPLPSNSSTSLIWACGCPLCAMPLARATLTVRLCSGRTWLERRWPQHRPATLLSRAGPHRSQGLAFPSPAWCRGGLRIAGIDRPVQGGRARDHKELQDARAAATRAASEQAATTRLVGIGESIPLMIGADCACELQLAAGYSRDDLCPTAAD